jgi:hypothetical protein
MRTAPLTDATVRALGEKLGKVLADRLEPIETELDALRAEVARLRALTEPGMPSPRRRGAQGVRHRFKGVIADPTDPGSALLELEDGSVVVVGKEAAGRWHDTVQGRA